eukprot:TRINITY_DN42472_c0_g1_i1.p1 TRINITY_DN42472_c0_g1~~TRINITY_DN42472_c0_g1_i1.p1  ORF type:complete len:403 (+),score=80.18 TRINITY_DN42472_c0_g1_i1:71-1210(+)
MPPFSALSAEEQAAIREAQSRRKTAKKNAKAENGQKMQDDVPSNGAGSVDAVSEEIRLHPDKITMDEYFGAAPYGLFRQQDLSPTEENLELVLGALQRSDKQGEILGMHNYFQFDGKAKKLWDPRFNARLAHEGFFTITTGRKKDNEPLPELQPFYSVVAWPFFEESKHVRKALKRVAKWSSCLKVSNNANPQRSWELLDAYHLKKYGANWLTKQYFDMIMAGSADPSVNFRVHCIELYVVSIPEELEADDESAVAMTRVLESGLPLAGEVGFSIGDVYTSLSGWTAERTHDNFGTSQLVLLGRWLQQRQYAFWSLGHCYSPHMEYKRELGHRVVPRKDFLVLLKKHRGPFTNAWQQALRCKPLADGESRTASELVPAS